VPEQRVAAGQAERAIAKRDQAVIGHMTPHTLRRTFASILAEVGVPPRRAMYLLGDTDPTPTMRVYSRCSTWAERQLGSLKGCSAA
jgi:integrase